MPFGITHPSALRALRHYASIGLIAATLVLPPGKILFVTNVIAELDAARTAGMQVVQCVRGHSTRSADRVDSTS